MDIDRNRESAETKRKRRLRRRLLQIAIIAIGAAIIIAIIAVVNYALDSYAAKKAEEEAAAAAAAAEAENDDSELMINIKYLWYFDETREERYIAFAAARPELSYEEVCWMVNVDLDRAPYTMTTEVSNPKDIRVLVTKQFYLPEGFAPDDLISVSDAQLRKEAGDALNEMMRAAWAEGHTLWTTSGFRTFEKQEQLYNGYMERDGQAVADTFSARPGYSEHQTGLALDLNNVEDAFGDTPEGKWVAENCWEYGFIVRYTKENTDITRFKPEPWHVRYIGIDAAKKMHDEKIASFEEYWVKYVLFSVGL